MSCTNGACSLPNPGPITTAPDEGPLTDPTAAPIIGGGVIGPQRRARAQAQQEERQALVQTAFREGHREGYQKGAITASLVAAGVLLAGGLVWWAVR